MFLDYVGGSRILFQLFPRLRVLCRAETAETIETFFILKRSHPDTP